MELHRRITSPSHRSFRRILASVIVGIVLVGTQVLAGVSPAYASALRTAGTRPRSGNPPLTLERRRAQAEWFQRTHYGKNIPSLNALDKARKQAQVLAANSTVGPSWTPLGPQPIDTSGVSGANYASGRVTALAVNPQNSSEVWAGSANGGAWSSVDGGQHWVTLTDDLPSLSIGSIAIDSMNTNVIYFGTGEPNGSDSYWGLGILKTTDGGSTWTMGSNGEPLGYNLFAGLSVSKIVVDPTNDQVVLAAVCCQFPGISVPNGATAQNVGIWRSTDGGATWCPLLSGAPNPNPQLCAGSSLGNGDATDLVMDPADHNVVFAGMANGTQGTIYKSTDNGLTWQQVSGLPSASAVERTSVGISSHTQSQGPQHLYAALTASYGQATPRGELLNGDIYESTDEGTTWTPISVPTPMAQSAENSGAPADQWGYDSLVAVDPTNDQVVYAGDIDVWQTTNGGGSWTDITNSYAGGSVHPDQHAIAFLSDTSSAYYLGNDGGVWQSDLYGAAPFTDLNQGGLSITQFYGGSVGTTGGQARLYGASQDNGVDQYPAGNIVGSQTWTDVLGGDGLRALVDPTNNATVYAETSGAGDGDIKCPGPITIQKSTTGGGASGWSCVHGLGSSASQDDPQPFVMSPNNSNELFVATDHLDKSTDGGNSWTSLGNFSQENATAMAVAPGDDTRVYVGTSAGNVYVSLNGGSTFSHVQTNQPSLPNSGAIVTALAVDPSNEDIVYATYSTFAYSGPSATCPTGPMGCHVWKSTDFGSHWTDISASLPNAPFGGVIAVRGSCTSSCQAANSVIAASDVGVFESTNGGSSWSQLGTGLPATAIDQVFADQTGFNVYVATHGRGMWTIPLVTGTLYIGDGTDNVTFGVSVSSGDVVMQAPVALGDSQQFSTGDTDRLALSNGILYGDAGQATFVEEAISASSGAAAWEYPVSGCNISSADFSADGATVANGLVYFSSCDNSVYALNAGTGALAWHKTLSRVKGAYADTAPIVSGGVVYVGSTDHSVYALNASTGALNWSYATGSIVASTPTVANGVVYVGSDDDYVYAINAGTHALVWRYPTGASVLTSPAAANGIIYVGSADDYLYALNATTGTLVWRYFTSGAEITDPLVATGMVYTASGGTMYALNMSTGALVWRYSLSNQESWGSPLVSANGIVFGAGGIAGVYAINGATGAMLDVYCIRASYSNSCAPGDPLLGP